MRPFDKKNAIKKANLLAEQRYLAYKGINESSNDVDETPIGVDSKNEPVEKENKADKVTLDVPLLIRLMEFSKEDASEDVDLHVVAENLVKLSESGKSLSMEDYDAAVEGAKTKDVSEE